MAACNNFVSSLSEMNSLGFQVDWLHILGKGRFGTVYRCSNRQVAVKIVKNSKKDTEDRRREATLHEIIIRRRIWHPNLVRVQAVQILASAIAIVMELCEDGNLNDYFLQNPALCNASIETLKIIIQMASDMIKGLAYLHANRLAHRDIKPDNIMLKSQPGGAIVAKIGDFGLMRELDADPCASSEMNSDVGSLFFQSPEFFEHDVRVGVQYGRKADVYSLALVLLSMIQARPKRPLIPIAEGLQPFNLIIIAKEALRRANNAGNGLSELVILRHNANDSELLVEFKQIIRDMLQVYPEDRLSSNDAQRITQDLIRVRNIFTFHSQR